MYNWRYCSSKHSLGSSVAETPCLKMHSCEVPLLTEINGLTGRSSCAISLIVVARSAALWIWSELKVLSSVDISFNAECVFGLSILLALGIVEQITLYGIC